MMVIAIVSQVTPEEIVDPLLRSNRLLGLDESPDLPFKEGSGTFSAED